MTAVAPERMASRLTVPFAPGADTLEVGFAAGATPAQGTFAAYDFGEHHARFDRTPDPRYVVTALEDVPAATQLTFTYAPTGGVATRTAVVDVPARTLAGASFFVSLANDEGPDARLRQLASSSPSGPDAVDEVWKVTALLGNMAKLLWVLGAERDALRGYLAQVRSQRSISRATGLTLDLFGYDLGVQRFPPQPYSFDEKTVALYHLDDLPASGQPEVETVANLIERYGGKPHPGTNVKTGGQARARSGVAGRFGTAFAFRDDAAVIEIPNDSDFALAAGDDFTAECFLSADDAPADGHVLSKHADPADATKAGWALSVGDFGRGIRRNVRFTVGDGTHVHEVFLDESLDLARFVHVAAAVDRTAEEARLYVDGRLRAAASIADVGALTNTEPVRIGKAANAPFKGVVDEVRLSRAARSRFNPVLGESDESYKTRLQIFERWTLPSPTGVLDALNRVAGSVGGDSAPFLVEDADSPTAGGRLALRIYPDAIDKGRHIAADGDRQLAEAEASGTVADDPVFDPIFLVTHTGATYAAPPARPLPPGEPPPDPRKLQVGAARALDRLVALPGVGAQLRVESGFDPEAPDLRAVGRAVLLGHPAQPAAKLAALAHRAGFTWVANRAEDGLVYASVAPGDYVEIAVTGGNPTTSTGFDALVGEELELTAGPPLPTGVLYEWRTIACGAARADFTLRTDQPKTRLRVTAPGRLAVQLRVTRRGRSFAATRIFRTGLAQLPDGQSIAADGRTGVDPSIAGRPDDVFFDPTYLVTFPDDRATYGNVLDNRRMQPAVASRLSRLLDLVAATGAAGSLHVAKPAPPQPSSLEAIGRVLDLDHFSLAPERLGALCHAAGFTFVRRNGTKIRVVQAAEDLVSVQPVSPTTTELVEGDTGSFTLTPRAAPRAVAVSGTSAFVACSGTDTVTELDLATGRVLTARKVGWEPVGVAAAGTSLFSVERRSHTVTRIDVAGGAVRESVDLGQEPVGLAVHPSQPRLYAALANGSLVEVDTSVTPIAVKRTVALGGTPVALALTANGGQAWVALAEGRVAVVDTGTFAAPAVVALPAAPADLALAQTTAYVTVPANGRLVLVDVATRAVQPAIAVGGAPGPVALGQGGAVFVLDTDGGRLLRRKANGDPDGQVRTGHAAADLLVAGGRVYVVNRSVAPGPGSGGTADGVIVVDAARLDVVAGWQLGSGLGERLTWTVSPPGLARLSSTTASQVDLTAERAGALAVAATYVVQNRPAPAPRATPPFTFEVRLNDALQNDPKVVIRKEQYDLVMNVLNAFHPVGVEVVTEAIREKVVEVRENLIEVFPEYTYPNFRLRGPDPRPPDIRAKTIATQPGKEG
jgi:DNA-binding beta-propeller fold protein YncE